MGKKSRSKVQRKQKLLKKQRKARLAGKYVSQLPVLPYKGGKYRTAEMVPLHLATERGIMEAFHVSGKKLTDAEVVRALERLVRELRSGRSPLPEPAPAWPTPQGTEEDLILSLIRNHWQAIDQASGLPERDTLVGVLRSVLGSVDTWTTAGSESRGYLHYLQGFMHQAGFLIEELREEDEEGEEDEYEEEYEYDESEEDLLLIGRTWCRDRDDDAGVLFRNLCRQLMDEGEAEYVAEVCQQLIGENYDPLRIADLSALALAAQSAVKRLTS
jgi:hypothetical protein